MQEALIKLEGLKKSFGQTEVLRGLSLTVDEGEFVTLLGPSGCGKTTTLRIVSGLTHPDEGRVVLGGEDITMTPPEKRPVNTVFQNYALFPHMNVEKNIAYGMRIKWARHGEWAPRVKEMLSLVKLEGYEKRMPSELSGGQRQRVAIARAVILRPKLLLLDEPLGALDLNLRRQMQLELKEMQKRLGIAFIYITHDQEEALNMSDRICVMKDGLFEQIGTPQDVYERPQTRFVARFIGQSELFEGEALDESGRVKLSCGMARARGVKPPERVVLSIHPERICYTPGDTPGFQIPARVKGHVYTGSMVRTELVLEADGRALNAVSSAIISDLPAPDTRVNVYWDERHAGVIREAGAE